MQILLEQKVDFTHSSELLAGIELEVIVLPMHLFAGVETLQNGVKKACITQILQAEDLKFDV